MTKVQELERTQKKSVAYATQTQETTPSTGQHKFVAGKVPEEHTIWWLSKHHMLKQH
jgi:hypothetical protein